METSEFGKTISPTEAKVHVEAYKSLRDKLIDEVLEKSPESEKNKETVDFHKSEANAFIFDAALIRKFFEKPNPAEQLMVFLGADGKNPTIVVTGVKRSSNDPSTFKSVGKPPVQHPKRKVDAKFPDTDSDDYYFTLH